MSANTILETKTIQPKQTSIIWAVDIADELIDQIGKQCNQLGFEILNLSESKYSSIHAGNKSCDLMLINVDGLLERIKAIPGDTAQRLKEIPCIGIYSFHPSSVFSLCEYANLHYLVPANELEHIVFAIRKESEYLRRVNAASDTGRLLSDVVAGHPLNSGKTTDVIPINVKSWNHEFLEKDEFMGFLERYLTTLSRKENGALALIDIDHYRTGNNSASESGLLADVMHTIKARSRQFDLIGRFSTTTFAFFSTRFNTNSFPVFAEHLRLTISENLYEDDGDFLKLKCSIGVCFWNEHITNTKELIARAEQACAKASIGDGNQVQIYQNLTTSLDVVEGKEKNSIQIKTALTENRFRLIFQPIVTLTNKSNENYAVLLRMIDDDGRHITPDRFLPIAENEGLISYIDQWVLKRAIELLKNFRIKGTKRKFFIKISGYSLMGDRMIRCLFYYLKKANMDGKALVLQIDYAEYINNKEKLIRFIQAVKKAKCNVAFDHFGFGKYSTGEMNELPLDYVKIDGTFTRHLLDKEPYRQTVQRIQTLATECGIQTIAKSVENAHTLALLWNMGVDAAQGYFIQPPAEEMQFSFPSKIGN